MSTPVEDIEKKIEEFTEAQMKQFRAWFERFDAKAWDRQIEQDIRQGKLDALADEAVAAHNKGKSREL